MENVSISELRSSNLLDSIDDVAGVVKVLFSQLPVFNRALHEARDHDEGKDEHIDAGEHFVH